MKQALNAAVEGASKHPTLAALAVLGLAGVGLAKLGLTVIAKKAN
jgi:hypothetical protein